MRLKDKVAIVTGGGSGIGRACCKVFAGEGARVVAADRVSERARETAQMVEREGGKCIAMTVDVTRADDIDSLFQTTSEKFGPAKILVNNAGILLHKSLMDTTEEEWDTVLNVNLKSVFLCSKRAIGEMLKTGGGKIVNISSLAAQSTDPYQGAYTASKAGVIGLTRAMALEFSRRRIGINCICPGAVRTNILAPADQIEVRTRMEGVPIGYMAEPEDIASVALFLASEDSDYMVGEAIVVDGGVSKNMYPFFSPFSLQEGLAEADKPQ
jgi:NAD(P)-dependent dehydrogenase (short-subunit alcohol dehydrogenase family)